MNIDFELIHDDMNKSKNGVLLFHGLTGSPFEMKKYGDFLFQKGFDVYCYAFPGHGEDIKNIETVTCMEWCDFAQEKYTLLRKKYDKFFVSGLCLGASMSIYLAENNSDITGIIPLSTTLFLDGFRIPWTSKFLPFALSTICKYYFTFPEDKSFGVRNKRTRKSLVKITESKDIGMDNYPLNCVDQLLKLSKIVRKNLKKVKCPLLCIHSKYDNLASTKGAKIVMEGVSSPLKKYVELKKSYHMVLYDNEKGFVMSEVYNFLSTLTDTKDKETELV